MSILSPLRELDHEQRHTVLASFLGWTLDAFDYFLLTFVIVAVAKDFDVGKAQVTYALFLTLAAALAYRRDLPVLVTGVCETDFSGYPDCRDDTMKAMQVALSLGMDRRFLVETPLMWIDKAETWALAQTLGGEPLVELIVETTHTCYLGDRSRRHAWGYGCGQCPACELRARGHERWRASRAAR